MGDYDHQKAADLLHREHPNWDVWDACFQISIHEQREKELEQQLAEEHASVVKCSNAFLLEQEKLAATADLLRSEKADRIKAEFDLAAANARIAEAHSILNENAPITTVVDMRTGQHVRYEENWKGLVERARKVLGGGEGE